MNIPKKLIVIPNNSTHLEGHGKLFLTILMFSMAVLMLLPMMNASLGTFRQGSCIEIKTILNASVVNISSLSYPNSSVVLTNTPMTKNGLTFNYTFCNTNLTGTYIYDYNDGVGNVYVNDFEITHSGTMVSESQGLLSIGIIMSIILLMIFFGWLSFKFIENDSTFGIGIFFLVLSLILSLYSLFLGFIFSRDFLFTNISNVQEKVFLSGLFGLTGIMFIAFIFLIVKSMKEIKIRKTEKQYGEGYNTRTQTYEY